MDREEKQKHILSLKMHIKDVLIEYPSKNKDFPIDDSSILFFAIMEILHDVLHVVIDTGVTKEEVVTFVEKIFGDLIISLEKR